jgi:hypothetical protein
MDAFEEIVANIFRRDHYWTCISYKVKLTKEVKKLLNNPSMPRPEIDVLAYRPSENRLLWIECKSYLDSVGVKVDHFTGDNPGARAQKMFNNDALREAVTKALVAQLQEEGLVLSEPQVHYCLVAGKIASNKDRAALHTYFDGKGWLLFDETWLQKKLVSLAELGYENDTAIMVAKLFIRHTPHKSAE